MANKRLLSIVVGAGDSDGPNRGEQGSHLLRVQPLLKDVGHGGVSRWSTALNSKDLSPKMWCGRGKKEEGANRWSDRRSSSCQRCSASPVKVVGGTSHVD